MEREVFFESEERATSRLNFLVKHSRGFIQMVITDDDDENHIPNVDFEYELCDCKQNNNLTHGLEWKKFLESDKAVIFTNTSYLFKQFDNFQFLSERIVIEDGAQAWAQVFYYFLRDKMWKDKKARLIFLVTDENITKMVRYVNNGFSILLTPISYTKKESSKNPEGFVKKYKID